MSPMSHFAERSRLPPGPVRSLVLHPSLLIPRPAVVRRRHRARHHSREESPQRVGATSPGRKAANVGRQVETSLCLTSVLIPLLILILLRW